MAYTYRVSANALRRIQEAVVYLENDQRGFGMAFDAELQDCMVHICEFPEMAPPSTKTGEKLTFHVLNIILFIPFITTVRKS